MGNCLFIICEFCNTRCFVPDPRRSGVINARLATCEEGQEADKQNLGYSWDEISREYCWCKDKGAYPHPRHDAGDQRSPAPISLDADAPPYDARLEPHEETASLTCGCIIRRLEDGGVTITHCFAPGA